MFTKCIFIPGEMHKISSGFCSAQPARGTEQGEEKGRVEVHMCVSLINREMVTCEDSSAFTPMPGKADNAEISDPEPCSAKTERGE